MAKSEHLLLGRYQLERLLARGGMAEVYLGRDEQLDRPVAIKLLYPHLAADAAFVKRFQREAKAAASLAHLNVVRCYDVGERDGRPFLVMEYVAGESLAQLLEREGSLPPERALAIVRPVLTALAHAHANSLVHRDVKPANVLLAREGQVKLADFGIVQALAATTITRTGQVLGSVHYVAPERLAGARASPAADCYAVGVMLYRMLTGRLPFDGETIAAVIAQQLHTAPTPPSALQPSLPDWLDHSVLRALAKDPAQRYESAASMLADLDARHTSHDATARVLPSDSPSVAEPTRLDLGGPPRGQPPPIRPDSERTIPFDQPAPTTRRGPRIPALFGWGVIVGALVLALLYFGTQLGASRPPDVAGPQSPASPPGLAAAAKSEPTITPRTPLPATPVRPQARAATAATPVPPRSAQSGLRQELRELRGLVQQALSDGRLTKEGRELQKELEKLERQVSEGKLREAREQVQDITESVRELAAEDQIDRALLRTILSRLANLAGNL